MHNDCPYCSLAKKKGELFCSQHEDHMQDFKSGVFFIRSNAFEECAWHVTRLSLNFNFDDRQVYQTPSHSYTVSPEKYLLLNEGQSFKTLADSASENRMVTIAFQVGLAEKLEHGIRANDNDLLDDPFRTIDSKTHFFENTYPLDYSLYSRVTSLTEIEDESALDQALEDLLLEMLHRQMHVRKEILSIKKAKLSTRIEVYKRLHWSMDYLRENFAADLSVEDLAAVACLSTFHYKRLFSELFRISPYQYLIKLRLEKACSLLHGQDKVSEICRQVGWKDPSSFSRLFRRQFSVTPERYRHKVSS